MKISLLISGGLGLEVLEHLLTSDVKIICVLTNKTSTEIIDRCEAAQIPTFIGNPRNGKGAEFAKQFEIDLILSVNYLFIIEKDLFSLASISCNIHGSLLPKYRGRTPHIWAIINNERKAGITAHLIDEGCDTGDIIRQVEVQIAANDTGADILLKYNKEYLPLVDAVLQDFRNGTVNFTAQDHSKATLFGKRTPEDGLINWNWQKERIRNWVRAQANPYPGAFTYLEKTKIIIDEIVYSDLGFEQSQPNGLVISSSPLLVKTPNGVIELKKVRNNNRPFEKGQILGQ
jgi:methionyl-tRNA formyltransferase